MLLKRNLLQCLIFISSAGTFVFIFLNYISNISPFTGIWFLLYVLVLFIVSLVLSFKFMQWLLHVNKPLKYDLVKITKDYPYLSTVHSLVPKSKVIKARKSVDEYDTNQLSVISTVLERKLVSSWYVPYISEEIGFPFSCKQMLDQMISKSFQICSKIESKDVYVDMCTILATHLKEYKKTLKRYEKAPTSTIESLYKKSHPTVSINKNCQATDHTTNIIRIVLKELVSWELWETPQSELLVRILSKKLHNFIDCTLADPNWLKYKLITILGSKKNLLQTFNSSVNLPITTTEIKNVVIDTRDVVRKDEFNNVSEITIESALSTVINKTTAPILKRPISEDIIDIPRKTLDDSVEEAEACISEPLDIKSPIMRQKRGRQGRNEVKVYDRVIEGSVKTWANDVDLQCISLGEDLLTSLEGEVTLSRLWGHEPDGDGSPNPQPLHSSQALWFGEEDSLDMELVDSPKDNKEPNSMKKELSTKPADALLKDIQSTVHQAKSKIGDLQVDTTLIDVPRPRDEAAGMMEGLLDFGLAGWKKGLRFTGLSDDLNKSPSHHSEPHEHREASPEKGVEQKEDVISTTTFIQKDENTASGVPPLLKQQRVTSQDSLMSQSKPIKIENPPLIPVSDSPEPEYEEAADLSTSIAKLRALLNQRHGNDSNTNEDIWWESAEETRGRATHRHSSRRVDTATLADEYDMNMDRNTSPTGPAFNNMQRLDKLFQRTVTGVFNSIKTAVGGEGDDVISQPVKEWNFVFTSIEQSCGGAIPRLVCSRRATSHVDAALDSLHALSRDAELKPDPAVLADDFDEYCWALYPLWTASCEAMSAAGVWSSHVAHTSLTLLLADIVENLISSWLDELSNWLKNQVFTCFEEMSNEQESPAQKEQLTEYSVDETCKAVMESIPELYILDEETVSNAVKLTISSFSHKELNIDVLLRALDIITLHFKKSASGRNPSFDNS